MDSLQCMHEELTLPPEPSQLHGAAQNPTRKRHLQIVSVRFHEDGTELWVAYRDRGKDGRVLLHGHRYNAQTSEWQLRYALWPDHLPVSARSGTVELHLLPSVHRVALVFQYGFTLIINTKRMSENASAIDMERYQQHKSRAITSTVMRSTVSRGPSPSDVLGCLTHVRFHVGRQCLVLDRWLISDRPASGRCVWKRPVVEVTLKPIWRQLCVPRAGKPAPPSQLLDAAWACTSEGLDGMLIALDTSFVRIVARQRGSAVVENKLGELREPWVASALGLPVDPAAASLPPSHHASRVGSVLATSLGSDMSGPSTPSLDGADAPIAPMDSSTLPPGLPRAATQPAPSISQGSSSIPFFNYFTGGGSVAHDVPPPTPLSHNGIRSPSVPTESVVSSRITNRLTFGSLPGTTVQQPRCCLRIMPLKAGLGSNSAAGAAGAGKGHLKYLVLSPPFMIAVDASGQPDPTHDILDMQVAMSSQPGIALEGGVGPPIDAAVAGDKVLVAFCERLVIFEWATTHSQSDPGDAHGATSQHLDVAQCQLYSRSAYSDASGLPRVTGGPDCPRLALFGPRRMTLFAPEMPGRSALRLVLKGDYAKALLTLQEAAARGQPPWLQRVVGLAVAECLAQDRWHRALQFFELADASTLHSSQLLATLLPVMLRDRSSHDGAAAATTSDTAPPAASHSLLSDAAATVRAVAAYECPAQDRDVSVKLEELMLAPAASSRAAIRKLAPGGGDANGGSVWALLAAANLHSRANSSVGGASPEEEEGATVLSTSEAYEFACALKKGTDADTARGSPESAAPERFTRLEAVLSAHGELYPDPPRGLPDVAQRWRESQSAHAPQQASTSAVTANRNGVHVHAHAQESEGASVAEDEELEGPAGFGLDWWYFSYAAQLWLLNAAGRTRELEDACRALGDAKRHGAFIRAAAAPDGPARALVDLLVETFRAGGHDSAAGLLLAAARRTQDALKTWMAVVHNTGTACATLRRRVPPATALADAATLDESIVAALPGPLSSGARQSAEALLACARCAETLCDPVAIRRLVDESGKNSMYDLELRGLPAQLQLAVLLARVADIDPAALISVEHTLEGAALDGTPTASHAFGSASTTNGFASTPTLDPATLLSDHEDSSFLLMPEPDSAQDQADAPGGLEGEVSEQRGDARLLVRYYRTQVDRSEHVDADGLALWHKYLLMLLRLLRVESVEAPQRGGPGMAKHPVYGCQLLSDALIGEPQWMSADLVQLLQRSDLPMPVATLLRPLRPVALCAAVTLSQSASDSVIYPIAELLVSELHAAPPAASRAMLDSMHTVIDVDLRRATVRPMLRRALFGILEVQAVPKLIKPKLTLLMHTAAKRASFTGRLEASPFPQSILADRNPLYSDSEEMVNSPQHMPSRVVFDEDAEGPFNAEEVPTCTPRAVTPRMHRSPRIPLPILDASVALVRTVLRDPSRTRHDAAELVQCLLHCVPPQAVSLLLHYFAGLLPWYREGVPVTEDEASQGEGPWTSACRALLVVKSGPDSRLQDVWPVLQNLLRGVVGRADAAEITKQLQSRRQARAFKADAEVKRSYILWKYNDNAEGDGLQYSRRTANDRSMLVAHLGGDPDLTTVYGGFKAPWCQNCKNLLYPLTEQQRPDCSRFLDYPSGSFLCRRCATEARAQQTSDAPPEDPSDATTGADSEPPFEVNSLATAARQAVASADGDDVYATATRWNSALYKSESWTLSSTGTCSFRRADADGDCDFGSDPWLDLGWRDLLARVPSSAATPPQIVLAAQAGASATVSAVLAALTCATKAPDAQSAGAKSSVCIVALDEDSGGLYQRRVDLPPVYASRAVTAATWIDGGRSVLLALSGGELAVAPYDEFERSDVLATVTASVPRTLGHVRDCCSISADPRGAVLLATDRALLMIVEDIDDDSALTSAALRHCHDDPNAWFALLAVPPPAAPSSPVTSGISRDTDSVELAAAVHVVSQVVFVALRAGRTVHTFDIDLKRAKGPGWRPCCRAPSYSAITLPPEYAGRAWRGGLAVFEFHVIVAHRLRASLLLLSRVRGAVQAELELPSALASAHAPLLLSYDPCFGGVEFGSEAGPDAGTDGVLPVHAVCSDATVQLTQRPARERAVRELLAHGRVQDARALLQELDRLSLRVDSSGTNAVSRLCRVAWSDLGRRLFSLKDYKAAAKAWGRVRPPQIDDGVEALTVRAVDDGDADFLSMQDAALLLTPSADDPDGSAKEDALSTLISSKLHNAASRAQAHNACLATLGLQKLLEGATLADCRDAVDADRTADADADARVSDVSTLGDLPRLTPEERAVLDLVASHRDVLDYKSVAHLLESRNFTNVLMHVAFDIYGDYLHAARVALRCRDMDTSLRALARVRGNIVVVAEPEDAGGDASTTLAVARAKPAPMASMRLANLDSSWPDVQLERLLLSQPEAMCAALMSHTELQPVSAELLLDAVEPLVSFGPGPRERHAMAVVLPLIQDVVYASARDRSGSGSGRRVALLAADRLASLQPPRTRDAHQLLVMLLLLDESADAESQLLEYLDSDFVTSVERDPFSTESTGLSFDAREALTAAARTGKQRAQCRLLVLLRRYRDALYLAADAAERADIIAAAPLRDRVDLSLLAGSIGTPEEAGAAANESTRYVVRGKARFEDVLALEGRRIGFRDIDRVRELMTFCMANPDMRVPPPNLRVHLESLEKSIVQLTKGSLPDADSILARTDSMRVCPVCRRDISDTPRCPLPKGGAIPPHVCYRTGDVFHTPCAVHALTRLAVPPDTHVHTALLALSQCPAGAGDDFVVELNKDAVWSPRSADELAHPAKRGAPGNDGRAPPVVGPLSRAASSYEPSGRFLSLGHCLNEVERVCRSGVAGLTDDLLDLLEAPFKAPDPLHWPQLA